MKLELIATAQKLHPTDLKKRAAFLKFEMDKREGKYWNIFIFTDGQFGKQCSASDDKYLLYRYNKNFYLIWFTRLGELD